MTRSPTSRSAPATTRGIHRVVALYQAGGDWQSLDLGASGGSFVGSLAVPAGITNEQIRVVVQVVDGAGNVSWAANKGPGFAPTPPPPPAPTVTLSPVAPASGWFSAPPQITVSGSPSATFDVSIDGGPHLSYLAPFTPALTNGSHVIDVTGSDGSSATITLKIDTTPPQITAALAPAANAAGWNNSTVIATYTCTDTVSGVAACPPPQSTGTNEGVALVLTGTAKDRAGLTTTVSSTVKVDRTAPTDPVVTLDPASRPIDQTSTVTATTSDALSGLAAGEWWIGDDPGIGNGTALSLAGTTLTGVVPSTLAPGSYVVSVRALDVAGNWSGAGTAALTVTSPVDNPPTADSRTVTTAEDTAVGIVLTGSDPDAADTLSFIVVTQPAHGVLSGTAPNLTYTPAADFNGADSFTFKINDGTVDSNTATVAISVTAVNDAPIAVAGSATTAEDTAVAVTLSGSDVDGDPLTFAIVSQPIHGTVSGGAANRTYTPAANFNGTDSFTFTVNDGLATSAPATVSITVTAVNDPPVANPASVSAVTAQPTPFTLSGTDVDGDALTFVIVSSPAHGTLTGTGPTFTYTSVANFAGSDSFSFAVSDGQSQSAAATVSITVTAPALGLTLLVSDSATRTTNLRPLDGVTLRSGLSAYIFVGTTGPASVRQVSFSLDGSPFTADGTAPFDFAGTSTSRACRTVRTQRQPVRVQPPEPWHPSHHGHACSCAQVCPSCSTPRSRSPTPRLTAWPCPRRRIVRRPYRSTAPRWPVAVHVPGPRHRRHRRAEPSRFFASTARTTVVRYLSALRRVRHTARSGRALRHPSAAQRQPPLGCHRATCRRWSDHLHRRFPGGQLGTRAALP